MSHDSHMRHACEPAIDTFCRMSHCAARNKLYLRYAVVGWIPKLWANDAVQLL